MHKYLVKHILGISVRVFLDEINILMGGLEQTNFYNVSGHHPIS